MRVRMRQQRVSVALLLAMAVVSAACSGPLAKLETGSKDVPVDLVLGAKVKKVAEAPLPPLMLTAPTASVFLSRPRIEDGPDVPFTLPRLPKPSKECPARNPLDPPKREAKNFMEGPPAPGSYLFRTEGVLQAGTIILLDVPLTGNSVVTVKDVAAEPTGGYVFSTSVAHPAAGTTTTTYRVLPTPVETVDPPGAVPKDLPRPAGAGPALYLAAIMQEGSKVPFRPGYPGIPIVRLPFEIGATFDAAGTDGTTALSWRSTVVDKAIVDACGAPLDSYAVELVGRVVSGDDGSDVMFKSTLHIGPQYGGLILDIDTTADGTAPPNLPIHRAIKMTANQEPKAP
ncbi:MAG: hypothetical protein QOK43_1724 [Acidimicrobiaceae bacterium]|nr:hypothetical protein [Acidimicrobiaceae bacterium]